MDLSYKCHAASFLFKMREVLREKVLATRFPFNNTLTAMKSRRASCKR